MYLGVPLPPIACLEKKIQCIFFVLSFYDFEGVLSIKLDKFFFHFTLIKNLNFDVCIFAKIMITFTTLFHMGI